MNTGQIAVNNTIAACHPSVPTSSQTTNWIGHWCLWQTSAIADVIWCSPPPTLASRCRATRQYCTRSSTRLIDSGRSGSIKLNTVISLPARLHCRLCTTSSTRTSWPYGPRSSPRVSQHSPAPDGRYGRRQPTCLPRPAAIWTCTSQGNGPPSRQQQRGVSPATGLPTRPASPLTPSTTTVTNL